MIRTERRFDFWARQCVAVGAAAALALGWTSSAFAGAGALDATFSADGKVTTDFTGCPVANGVDCPFAGQDEGQATTVQSDGKIVVAGYVINPQTGFREFALARYNRNGSLDTSFGNGGKVTTDVVPGQDSRAFGVAMQGNKIVMTGSTSLSGPDPNDPTAQIPLFATLVVVRYDNNGSLDPSFGLGGSGIVTFDIAGRLFAEGEAVAVKGDQILVAGTSGLFIDIAATAIGGDFLLLRFNYDGSLDTTGFGAPLGYVTTDFTGRNPNGIVPGVNDNPQGDSDEGGSIALTPDGKIVVAGFTIDPDKPDPATGGTISTEENFAVARYNWDGSLDNTFGLGGQVVTDIYGILDESHAVAVQPDGKVVVVGTTINAFAADHPMLGSSITEEEFAMLRYNTNGTLDTTFGWGGRAITDFSGGVDLAHGVALQPDGKIVVAGSASSAWPLNVDPNLNPTFVQDENFAVARYNINGTLDVNFATKVSFLNKSKRLLTKTGGEVETDFDAVGELDHAFAVVVDGYDIIAAGTSFNPVTGDDFAIAVYDTK